MIDKKNVKFSAEYANMQKYASFLRNRIEVMERILLNSPEGSIKLGRSHGKTTYYRRTFPDGKVKLEYIPVSDLAFAQALGDKKIADDSLRILKENLKACEFFLSNHSGVEDIAYAEQLVEKGIPYSRRNFSFPADRAAAWIASPGDQGAGNPKNVVITTLNGEEVRSKSEAIIADSLYKMNILYKYEYPLRLNNRQIFHPDFTIYDPVCDKFTIWEHFGMTDYPHYYDEMCRKLVTYQESGYIPGRNLICTFESAHVPMSASLAESMIRLYL